MTQTLYEQIGAEFIERAITTFYQRAFADGIIGHFFVNSDIKEITAQQIDFATNMLGGPKRYAGKPLLVAHQPFKIKKPHFGRRQVIMADVLTELGLADELKAAWLKLEDQLRPLIINSTTPSP